MNGIPDPEGVSGTFAAIDRATPIVQSADGFATTTSMRIARGTQNEHASVLRLVRDNLVDFEEFGLVGFEIEPRPAGQHGGGDVTIARLNEDHATLLLTFMRNNPVVKDFKVRLVREFSAMRRGQGVDLSDPLAALEAATARTQQAIDIAKIERAGRFEAETRNVALTEKIADDAPKVNYVELYVADADLLKLRTVAASNDVGETWLRDLLCAKDWIYVETERRWSNANNCMEIRRRYSAKSHKRSYFRPVEVHEAPRFKGEVMHTLKVTPTGAEAIARLIAKETNP